MFSPRDFKAFIIEETETGSAPTYTANALGLDIDSISIPSLSPNQVTAVKSRGGRVLHKEDFFQDNQTRQVEISLSGNFHKDSATMMLMQSVMGVALDSAVADLNLSANPTGFTGAYGATENNKTFSLLMNSPSASTGRNFAFAGCLCTSFTISADTGTEGGIYKYEATIVTGITPTTNSTTVAGTGAFGSSLISLLSATSADIYVGAIQAPVINSFSLTIESPAVFSGFRSNGYHSYGRASEFTVTANASIKYDTTTKLLYHTFNTQSAPTEGNFFAIPQASNNCGISMPDGILTDVAFNEGDVMMLDVAMQGVSDGSNAIVSLDLA
mgnify:CR=1 FL=1